MPHIIVEYSQSLDNQIDIPALLYSMHESLGRSCGQPERVKSRAIAYQHCLVGQDAEKSMIHITLLLLDGRDDTTKQDYAKPIHRLAVEALSQSSIQASVTLDVRDMDRQNYLL